MMTSMLFNKKPSCDADSTSLFMTSIVSKVFLNTGVGAWHPRKLYGFFATNMNRPKPEPK